MPSVKRATPAVREPMAIFGDVALGVWGLLTAGPQPRLAFATLDSDPADIRLEPATVDSDDDEIWLISAARHTLRLERGQATAGTPGAELDLQPVRVTGTADLGGELVEIDIAGVLSETVLSAETDSLRLFGSWFPAGHQIVLRAERPRGAKGQDRDRIGVVALGEDQQLVFDPRLSTTYESSHAPRVAGLELWLGADEEGDQLPRRVSGVATGSSIRDTSQGVELIAGALQCLSRGEAGVGVYVLLRQA